MSSKNVSQKRRFKISHPTRKKNFRFAAELALEVRKKGIKTRKEYFAAAAKDSCFPRKPQELLDWPSRVEPRYSEKEAWQIFFGTFKERRAKTKAKSRFFRTMIVRKQIRAAERLAENFTPSVLFNYDPYSEY